MSIYNHTARYISSIGSRGSKVAVVSQAPRAKEQALGRGYVSSESKTLTDMLTRVGITRNDLYLTYVIKERLPKDDLDFYITFPKFGSKPPVYTEKYIMYLENLKKDLIEWDGNVIVAVGRLALYALTGLQGINNWRGSVVESTLVPGKKVIPILDPLTAQKMYIYTYLIMDDLVKVKKESKYTEIIKRERNLIIAPTFHQAMSFLSEAASVPRIGTDIEGLYWMSCFSIAISETEAMSIPLVDSQGSYFTPDKEAIILKEYAKILANKNQEHVFQNGIYDFDFLFNEYGMRIYNIHDSMLAHRITYPDQKKGLDLLTSIYTDMNYYKEEGKRGIKGGKNDKQFWLYNAKDSVACLEAFNKCEIDTKRLNNESTYNRQRDIIPSLVFIQSRGIKVDVAGLRAAAEQADDDLIPLYAKLNELCGYEINPNSPLQLKDYFYKKKKVTPIKTRVKGKWVETTNEKALKTISSKGFKEAGIILAIRHIVKEKGTYLEMVFRDDGRFTTSFDPGGTKNGRLSSRMTLKKIGGNSQNIPYSIRRYFLADDGYMGYEIDLSQAENRIMAYVADEHDMIEAFESGVDIHRKTASMIFGIDYNEISDEKGSSHLGNGTQSQRYWGKTSNHSFNYDLGARSAATRFELAIHEAQHLINSYHKAYPGIRRYHTWVKETLANENRQLTNLMGRTRRFLGRWEDSLFKEAYNFIPQSTVADVINQYALSGVYNDQVKFKHVELLNQVHDSIWVQIPLTISPSGHQHILGDIIGVMQPKLTWRSHEFIIPAEAKMGYNFQEMVDVTPDTWTKSKADLDEFQERQSSISWKEFTKELKNRS